MTTAPSIVIRIAKTFSDTPGGRYRSDGPASGEAFLEEHLWPSFEQAKLNQTKLIVDMDGAEGYATSFLEEAFGGLARKVGPAEVLERLEFICQDEPLLVDEIKRYILDVHI